MPPTTPRLRVLSGASSTANAVAAANATPARYFPRQFGKDHDRATTPNIESGRNRTMADLHVCIVGGNAVSAFLSWRLSATQACDVTLVWKNGFENVHQYGISFR